jgi:hypothetical protein
MLWALSRCYRDPRVPLYLFFKKDAAAPANAAMAVNKVRRFRPGFSAHPIYRPRNKRLPHPGSLVSVRCANWSTRPPVLRQPLVFFQWSMIANFKLYYFLV